MDEYQLRRDALFEAEVSAVQTGNTEEFYRINAELDALDNEFQIVQEIKEPSYVGTIARNAGKYVLGGFAVLGLAFAGAAKDMAGSSLEDTINTYFSGSNDAQMVGDLDVNQTVTNGDYIANLEDNRVINIIDVESGSEIQIPGDHYQVGSMAIDGDVLQYTTMSLQGTEGLYRLNEFDMTTSQTVVLKEELSAAEPDFYINQDTDGINSVYVDNNSVVLNGETIYDLGNNSLPSVNGDSVAFSSEQTEDNKTIQRVVMVTNGESNTIYSGNQSVEFVEFLDGEVVYGLENLLDNKTVDLHVGDAIREIPSGMFDVDNGNLTWIEQTEDGFEIKLYNFETDQTENIYVSTEAMRNPQISEDIVTWEQKHGLSDSFKAWYSDVANLMTFESDVSVDNGTVDNGTVDNGIVDNGTVDNGTDATTIPETTKTETEDNDYLGIIAAGLVGAAGLGYFAGKRKDKKMANEVASIVDDRLGAAASADDLNEVAGQMEGLNERLNTYGTFKEQWSNMIEKEAELNVRDDECKTLETLLQARKKVVNSKLKSLRASSLGKGLPYLIVGVALAGVAGLAEYTGFIDIHDWTSWRG